MIKRLSQVFFFLALCLSCQAQRMHLEVGGTLGFKDELHLKPSFDPTSRVMGFHIYDLSVFSRVSKLKMGGEFGLGFEKAGNYFIRRVDNTRETKFLRLNRISVSVSPFVYLHKSAKTKWDLQLGIRNYFNTSSTLFLPHPEQQKIWKLAGRISSNITYKTFLVGLYYEQDVRGVYSFKERIVTFGIRFGLIY